MIRGFLSLRQLLDNGKSGFHRYKSAATISWLERLAQLLFLGLLQVGGMARNIPASGTKLLLIQMLERYIKKVGFDDSVQRRGSPASEVKPYR